MDTSVECVSEDLVNEELSMDTSVDCVREDLVNEELSVDTAWESELVKDGGEHTEDAASEAVESHGVKGAHT